MARWKSLWINANLATFDKPDKPFGTIENAAIAVSKGRISWIGKMSELSGPPNTLADSVTNCDGKWITPGLIDCHTHLVFGGNRVHEFEMRLEGASYEDIAREGGGILSTVSATRSSSEAELYESSKRRLESLMSDGVTTVEIKSGYGLDLESELKMLRTARRLGEELQVRIKTTFLGAHALPAEYQNDRAAYIELVCEKMLPQVASEGLADAVDVFCEGIGFDIHETRKVFEKADSLNIPVKIHSEQLSNLGGTVLACEFGALSADHLEYLDEFGVDAMAKSGTVAVLLAGAFYFLRESQLPPISALRAKGVPIAIATDLNPGSSPARSLTMMLNMASTLFQLTPEESLRGVTVNAAQALGLQDEVGSLKVGKSADFALWDISEPAELSYWMGNTRPISTVFAGNDRR